MNYYKRYFGDYQRKTSHLSLSQHGAYSVLLDHYYATAQPLPREIEELYRLCRAMKPEEQKAVRNVADKFFPVGEDGLRHNSRADEELSLWEAQADLSRQNGKKGGDPHRKEKLNQPGILFAVKLPTGKIRIGLTAVSVSQRLRGLRKTHGAETTILHSVEVDGMGRCEDRLLTEFRGLGREGIEAHQADKLIARMNAMSQPPRLASNQPADQPRRLPTGQPSSQPTGQPRDQPATSLKLEVRNKKEEKEAYEERSPC